ncbi:MAG: DUF881 domain-containing protein [Kineosporiaceae bacterium]
MEQDGAQRAAAAHADRDRRGARPTSHVARRRFHGWTAGVVVVSALAGGLFALSAQTSGGIPLRTDRADQQELLDAAAARNAEVLARVEALRGEIEAMTGQFAAVDTEVAALRQQSERLAPIAGLAPVRGTVVEVTLDDAPRGAPVPAEISPDDLVVHQQDVQAVVNALWDGGAEAMMLMDQRVVSTSAVRCVGNTLILQGRVYSPPYTVRAIGDPGRLRGALATSPQVSIYRQFVTVVGLGYAVDDRGVQEFPAFDGSTRLEHARPLEQTAVSPGAGTTTPATTGTTTGTTSPAATGSPSGAGAAPPSGPATSSAP